MRTVHLGFGANIDPVENAKRALEGLAETVRLRAVSTVYRTPALRRPDDPDFLNAAFAIETDLDLRELKTDVLRRLEDEAGRDREADAYAPRPLDLDILVDGDRCIDDDLLVVPDPDIYERWFVAEPLREIAGDLVLPDTGRRLSEVLGGLDPGQAQAVPDVTDELRRRADALRARPRPRRSSAEGEA